MPELDDERDWSEVMKDGSGGNGGVPPGYTRFDINNHFTMHVPVALVALLVSFMATMILAAALIVRTLAEIAASVQIIAIHINP